MAYHRWFWIGIASILSAGVPLRTSGQGLDASQYGNVHVHVVFQSEQAAGMNLRVRLLSGSGSTPVSENFTNSQGRAEFIRVPVGNYHVLVSGEEIEDSDSGEFEIDRRKTSQDLFITVRSKSSTKLSDGSHPSVALVDLKVPDDARKQFDEASKAMSQQQWGKAVELLKRAIAIYPPYAPAYNNLGVAYGRLNDPAQEREALEKAISLNEHFAPAFINLAKLCLRERNSAQAETLLEGALRVEPGSAENMTLLAEAQLLNQHFEAAVTTARAVHAIPHSNLAVVHYIAARAFEHENRLQDALAELQVFLTEEPSGTRADQVREEIAKLKNSQP